MIRLMGTLCALAATIVLSLPVTAWAGLGAVDRLIESLASTQTLVADFSQSTVMASARTRTASGSFWVSRPGLLRWEVKKPYAQLQILDGQQFWLYDPDLAQVTVRPLSSSSLTGIAALLLSGSSLSKEDLMARYTFRELGSRDGLEWVEVIPKKEEPGLARLSVGIDSESMLRRFEITDSLGQVTRMQLNHVLKNLIVNPEQFSFTPPKGVAVLRAP